MPALSADRSLRFTSTPLNDYGLGLAMTKISPTSSGVQHGMQAEGDQSETSMHPASEQHEPAAPGQDHPLSLLKKRRNRSGESSVRELSLNIERSPAKLTVPRSLSRSRSSGSSTPTTPGSDSIQNRRHTPICRCWRRCSTRPHLDPLPWRRIPRVLPASCETKECGRGTCVIVNRTSCSVRAQ